MENNNKESFKLLGMSATGSDSGSEVPEFVVTPRKKRVKRRVRGSSVSFRNRHPESCNCKGRTVGMSFAVILLLCWLIILTWLAIILNGELRRLDTNVHRVVAGSQDVPDALQKCHSLSRELQLNQTALFSRLEALTLQLGNFSTQLTGVQCGLRDVEDQLKSAPELVNIPRTLKELSASVASFGSQIRDLDATVTALKNQNNRLEETSKNLVQNVTTVKQAVGQLLNVSQQPQIISKEGNEEREALKTAINNLAHNVSVVNETSNKHLQWLKDDQQLDHKSVERLQDVSQNMSARVTTLEGECVKSSEQSVMLSTVNKLNEKVGSSEVQIHELGSHVTHLQTEFAELESNGSQLLMAVNDIHQTITKLRLRLDSVSQPQAASSEQLPPTQKSSLPP